MTRAQFEKFRTGRFGYNIAWEEAWTMDDSVAPLFPVPSCAVFGRKRAIASAMPNKVRAYSGRLPYRDAPEAVADARLTVVENAPALDTAQRAGGSPYRKVFRQGAILVPRAFVLIERRSSGRLGSNPTAPLVVSRRSPQEKQPWRDLPALEGNVERQFLHPVLLGESILPYRLFQPFEGVVPISPRGTLLDAVLAEDQGYSHLANWMAKAETAWDENGKGKRKFVEQLDYIGQLSAQLPIAPLRIVYAASGANPAAMVLRDESAIVEHILYWAAPTSEDEAHYLCTILNSETLRGLAERYQARGQFGARHFDKVVFNLPIPVFDGKKSLHRALAAAGAHAEDVARHVQLPEGERFVAARKRMRATLIEEGVASTIEKLVAKLLDG